MKQNETNSEDATGSPIAVWILLGSMIIAVIIIVVKFIFG